MDHIDDNIPIHIYPDIVSTKPPPVITRAWLDLHQPGCIGSSTNPIYYIELPEGASIRLSTGTYIDKSCYIPYDTLAPLCICYKDNIEIGAYCIEDKRCIHKVHTTGSLYGLKWLYTYKVTNILMNNIGYFGLTINAISTYREILVNGSVKRLGDVSGSLNIAVERCNYIGRSDFVSLANNNILYKTVLQMLAEYNIGDEMTLMDDSTGIVNRIFAQLVQTYMQYLRNNIPNPLTTDWIGLKLNTEDWESLLLYPITVPYIFKFLIKSPEKIKCMPTEIYDMIIRESKQNKINPEIVRKFVKTNALKYNREDLANYVGMTQTKCRRPSPLGDHWSPMNPSSSSSSANQSRSEPGGHGGQLSPT
jgi:hypothetical protein